MSAVSDRLTEEDLRELARIVRGIHARAAAKRERERQQAGGQDQAADAGGGDHDAG